MKVKNISGEDRIVQGRLVLKGAVLEVEPDEVWSYTQQEPNWAPADKDAQAIHDHEYATAHAVEEALAEDECPAGNASRDVWAAYVLAAELATEDDIKDMTRDEIRDTYGKTEG